jgi:Cft2 family RNA processing exonuclease
MKLTLHHAGHVLGAMMVEVTADEKTLLYTGDFCIHDTNILNGADLESLPKEPDALITESTYGDTIRPQRSELEHALLNEVHKTIMRKGNVLIPVFAFHRLQEMTERIETAMNEKTLPRYNAYYISNLGHKITRYYHQYQQYLNQQTRRQANPFTYSHLRRVFRTQQIKPPAIVICTSGFGHAGASHALLRQWAGHAQDAILVNTGYLPPDSPLFTAMKGSLEHEGTSIPVKATIEQISLSGHADQSELTTFIKNLKPQQTFLVHGTLDQTQPLASKIRPDTETHIPAKQDAWTI